MKTFEEDKELRQLLRAVKPESPGVDFSTRVMKRVFEEQAVLERVKAEPVLKRGFWVIVALFAVLIGIMIWAFGTHPVSESTPAFLTEMNTDNILTGYRAFFDKFGALPASLAGIFLASSLLVFLEKLLDSRRHVMQRP